MTVAVVVAGGAAPSRHVADALRARDFVICADSGLDHAYALGLQPTCVVGDMDSATEAAIARAVGEGVEIERHPADKERTDLELALDRAVELADRVVVVGWEGGRLDHLLGNLAVLAAARYATARIEALGEVTRLVVVRDEAVIRGEPGTTVSLLPFAGPARGVTTTGLRWRLDRAELSATSSRGISNELVGTEATVRVEEGVLLAIAATAGPDAAR